MKPSVTCLCCTYGRPLLLNEAVYSFLNQNYTGTKQLIILNTYQGQTLIYGHDEVKLFNVERRPSTLGECRNLCANQGDGELFLIWDDDDIFLPNYITMMVDLLDDLQWVKPQWRFNARKHRITDYAPAACHQIIYRREAWHRAGYYPHVDSGEDYAFVRRLRELEPNESRPHDWKKTQFIYGWENGHHHISGDESRFGYKNARKAVDRSIRMGKTPRGKIPLNPKWRIDYVSEATKFIQSQ